jgi:hypothetical protein
MRASRVLTVVLSASLLWAIAPAIAGADVKSSYTTARTGTGVRTFSAVARASRAGREVCDTYEAWRYGESLVGLRLWEYHQRVRWCWNRRKLTYVKRRRWGEVKAPVWDFKGHIGTDREGGTGFRYFRGWTQGKFQACAGQFGCWQTKTPWVEITVRRGGAASYRTGG